MRQSRAMKILEYKRAGFWRDLAGACRSDAAGAKVSAAVESVISKVRESGDAALEELTLKFDGARVPARKMRVSPAEIKSALAAVGSPDKKAIREAVACVKAYHAHTFPKNWRAKNPHGAVIGENFYPIGRVGLYVPGGHAPLVSTVVMTATLAKLAKCPEICVCTPPAPDGTLNPHILAALSIIGISEIYKIGGAQAIAAMALGTKTVKPVDKLFGPGNAYVVEAKRQLFGTVGVDLLPGPSEILVLADSSANPRFVASDMLSQAEHGSGREKIFLVTTSKKLVEDVRGLLPEMASSLSRSDALMRIIADGCVVALVPNLDAACEIANFVAPEHMELMVSSPEKLAPKIRTAGAILAGDYTPTVLGDFTAGPSHTLPTGRTGRFSGGLQLIDFMRRSSFVKYGKKSAARAAGVVGAFAAMERLDAHGSSLIQRLWQNGGR